MIHCLRSGTQTTWIWVIIFLPVVGSIAYIFLEMLRGKNVSAIDFSTIFNSKPSIKRLEENLRFTDTFNNRVMLADAYMENGMTQKAIDLYESSLTGAFEENEYVHMQLIKAYFKLDQFEKVVSIAKKISQLPTFPRSRCHMQYAIALEHMGKVQEAEKEFQKMQSRFSFYEPRYEYGLFLLRANRKDEAKDLYESMLAENSQLSPRERRSAAPYLKLVREELKKMENGRRTTEDGSRKMTVDG